MSKAMRIVDREIIERQVVNAWRDKSENLFVDIVEGEGFDLHINTMIRSLNDLCEEIELLEKKAKDLRHEIEENIEGFNGKHTDKDNESYQHSWYGTYISANLGHYGNKNANWEYKTNVPNSIRHGVSDELGMQTMGGDFNAKDLVAKLIEMFDD